MKRIKDNITKKDFRFLMNFIEADESIRKIRKDRLQKIFTLLYSLGIRLNEVQQINETVINDLLENGKSKIKDYKTNKEKIVYISSDSKKLIEKYFNPKMGYTIHSERGNGNKLHPISLINDVNSYLKKVFPNKNITSHSFRQTLITELSEKGINAKVIQTLVSHKDIKTTFRYIKVDENTIMNSLEIVR